MAAIVKRNKSYAVVYTTTLNGVRKQKWETYHSMEEAERRKWMIENYLPKAIGAPVTTVSQLMDEYIELYGKTKWSVSTFDKNVSLIRRYIRPTIGIMRLSELSPRIVAVLYKEMLQLPKSEGKYHHTEGNMISATTLRRIHKTLHCAFERAVLWEYIPRNPVHGAVLPTSSKHQQRILTAGEIAKMVGICQSKMLGLAIELTFACTLRQGELLALTWDDIDFEKHAMFINKTMIRVNSEALNRLGYKDVVHLFPSLKAHPTTRLLTKNQKRSPASGSCICLPPWRQNCGSIAGRR